MASFVASGRALIADSRRRRIAYALAAALFAILTIFPRLYVARVKLLPQAENSAGLSSVLGALGGGLQNFASLVASHQTIEIYVLIGRSHDVAADVVARLRLADRLGRGDSGAAEVALSHIVDVHALNGGVLEIEARGHDAAFSRQLVAAYADAIRRRVAALSLEQSAKKKSVVAERYRQATLQLGTAQAALDRFRTENRLADPQAQLGQAVALKAALQAQLQAKQIELQTVQQYAAGDNFQLQTIQSEIASIRGQISQAESAAGPNGANLTAIASKTAQYLNLYREARFAEALYEIYERSLQQVTVEEAIANADTNVQVLEPPNVDPRWHVNVSAAALLALVILAAAFTEFYAPATGLYGRRPRA
jgi:hypothetical protein